MAKIIPIDILKCVSGKFGGGKAKEYFATNKCILKFNTIVKTSPINTKILLVFFISHSILHHISSKIPINYPQIPLF